MMMLCDLVSVSKRSVGPSVKRLEEENSSILGRKSRLGDQDAQQPVLLSVIWISCLITFVPKKTTASVCFFVC